MSAEALKEHTSRMADEAASLSQRLADEAASLSQRLDDLTHRVGEAAARAASDGSGAGIDPTVTGLTVFVLACFVGYYVVWKVTPALHSPLMGVTNAISSVIVVGALIAAGPELFDGSKVMGFLAVTLASVNIFGGFIVTHRMLSMFKKKK